MRVVVDHSRSTKLTLYKGTAALDLHKYHDSFEATPHYKREKPKTIPEKCSGRAFSVSGYILLLKSLPWFKITSRAFLC